MNTGPADELPLSLAVLACQRSGTHLLREILNSNPQIAIYPEAMTADAGPGSWFYFLRSLPTDQVPPTSAADAAVLFDQYMCQMRRDSQVHCEWFGGPRQSPTWIGLDVKYNQIKCVNPLFTDLRSRPFLLDHFRNRQFHVIHLVRENLLHQAISLVMSNLRKVWRNYDGSTLQGGYRLPVDVVIGYMHWVQAERAEFERQSADLDVQFVRYEDVVSEIGQIDGEGRINENCNTLRRLADFLHVPNRFHCKDCLPKVLNRPYSEFIENYDEVASTVRDSEFAQWTETI